MSYLIPEVLLVLAGLCFWRYHVINNRTYSRYFLVSYLADTTIRGCCAMEFTKGIFELSKAIETIANKNKFTNVTIASVFELDKEEYNLSGPDLAKEKYENV